MIFFTVGQLKIQHVTTTSRHVDTELHIDCLLVTMYCIAVYLFRLVCRVWMQASDPSTQTDAKHTKLLSRQISSAQFCASCHTHLLFVLPRSSSTRISLVQKVSHQDFCSPLLACSLRHGWIISNNKRCRAQDKRKANEGPPGLYTTTSKSLRMTHARWNASPASTSLFTSFSWRPYSISLPSIRDIQQRLALH